MLTGHLRAQAKVNLFLRVLAREEDGYHSIETMFTRLDLADEVTVRVVPGARTLDCAGPMLPAAGLGAVEDNLVWRAATLYARETGWPSGFAIELVKHIPAGAGLGGGSADAAAVLRVLDHLAPHPLGSRVMELAGLLGADVPFLASGYPTALAWGRGDRLLGLPALPRRRAELVLSTTPVPTANAYRWLDELRGGGGGRSHPRALDPAQLTDWSALRALAQNDFEEAVFPRFPELARARTALLDRGAELVLLSGSGGTVFGIHEDPPPADGPRPARLVESWTSDRVADVARG
jgi:4-diphosphocytidyl-2-C-methyl-D-erythritol kinase